jgi:hypothetical protein
MITNKINKVYFRLFGGGDRLSEAAEQQLLEMQQTEQGNEGSRTAEQSLFAKLGSIKTKAAGFLRRKVVQVQTKAANIKDAGENGRFDSVNQTALEKGMSEVGAKDKAISTEMDRGFISKGAESVTAYTSAGLEIGGETGQKAMEVSQQKLVELRTKVGGKLSGIGQSVGEQFDKTIDSTAKTINGVGETYNSANSYFEDLQSQAGEFVKADWEATKAHCHTLKQIPANTVRSFWTGGKAYLKTKLQNAANRL